MTLDTLPTRFTPEDLLNIENEGLFELVDGKLVEKSMSSLASKTAGLIGAKLVNFLTQPSLGDVYPEQSFQCFPHDPALVRRPDIAVVLAERCRLVPEEGHVSIRPDIVVEVTSPTDKVYDFDEKLQDYRSAAIPLVWEVNPKFRFVRVHRLDRSTQQLEEADILSGEPVLPGFSIRVSELLPPVERTTK